ncbi:hypothetical protein BS47DRAFT_1388177 [Hydnum rufescens UP504]|uniref:F-box domain-containing protein n=1 Tax=Hydnum rufescens UP504 TaxID=1448309 RepID=A0A9P6B8S4_9AGAM|nr:hypothetical protein BS47DRAFT_1388177 [Hydnum rufescens UP504]
MSALGDLASFPTETLLQIFEYLDGRDLVRCQRVCKALRHHIDQCSATQYVIRLAMCGYTDGTQSQGGGFSLIGARLNALEEHINRWKYLNWEEQRIEIPTRIPDCEVLVGGIYVLISQTIITCVQLPSKIRHIPLRAWSFENDFTVTALAMDPSQDLLVLLEIRQESEVSYLHFRTLSDNTRHPRVFATIPSGRYVRSHDIMIVGDTIAFHQYPSTFTWNWCTGTLLSEEFLDTHLGGIRWIGPKKLLGCRWGEGPSGALVVFGLDQDGNRREIVALDLPVRPSSAPRSFSCFLGQLAVPHPSGVLPFDSSSVYIIHLSGVDFRMPQDFDLVIPVSTIERYASDRYDGPFSVPWDVWASENTRVVPHSRCRQHRIFRNRTVRVEAGAQSRIKVLDFTPNLSVWPDSSHHRPSDARGVCYTKFVGRSESAIDVYPETFARTNLPYHESHRILETPLREPRSVQVDDENIVIADVSFPSWRGGRF